MSSPTAVYRATRKKNDFAFNAFVMRPAAALVVSALARTWVTPNQLTLVSLVLFVASAAGFAALPTPTGAWIAVGLLELSYLLDCADGMLARWRKTASKEGHLFDFFTDEAKALLLVAGVSIRLFETGGWTFYGTFLPPHAPGFLLAGMLGTVVVASATSLTNFVRRPEISGRPQGVEAYYEGAVSDRPRSLVARAAQWVQHVLRVLNHYPTHIALFVVAGRVDAFLWMYIVINAAYLARGWLGLIIRFGGAAKPRAGT